MAVRRLVYFNDERLRRRARKIKQFTPELKQLAQDMLETMHTHRGIGLAGPQIGVMQRIFVAEIPALRDEGEEPHPQSGATYILINPEIVKTSQDLVEGEEGCLSIPSWYGLVKRPEWVVVQAQDVNGRKVNLKVDDLLARVFLHEMDHLNGVLFIDHIKDPEKLWQVVPESEEEESETAKAQIVE